MSFEVHPQPDACRALMPSPQPPPPGPPSTPMVCHMPEGHDGPHAPERRPGPLSRRWDGDVRPVGLHSYDECGGRCASHNRGVHDSPPPASAPALCSDCWFANGDGESDHCGRCRCCARAERAKGREEVLHALRNFTVAQELEALNEISPNCRRHMLGTIDLLRAFIEVEEAKP